LGITETTSLDVDHIIVITDSLSSAKMLSTPHIALVRVNPAYLLSQPQQQQQIEFLDCPSKARWRFRAKVNDNAKIYRTQHSISTHFVKYHEGEVEQGIH